MRIRPKEGSLREEPTWEKTEILENGKSACVCVYVYFRLSE